MFSVEQLICHGIGDYILQSDWMANNKTQRTVAALAHVATYGLPFLFLKPSLLAFAAIVVTHFAIDRWRLARYIVWLKNFIAPTRVTFNTRLSENPKGGDVYLAVSDEYEWRNCSATGYPSARPAWLAVWLLIIADNLLHIIINGLALNYL